MNLDPYQSPQVDPTAEKQVEREELIAADANDAERLGTLHYVLAAAAFLLSCVLTPAIRDAFELREFDLGLLWTDVARCLLTAPAVAAVALACWRRHERAKSFPTQAGHWLLLLQGVSVLILFLILSDFWQSLFTGLSDPRSPHYELHMGVQNFVWWSGSIGAPCLAIYFVRGEPFWRIYFVIWVAQFSFNMFQRQVMVSPEILSVISIEMWQRMLHLQLLLSAALALAFLVAVARDVGWRRSGRDPLHWIGIGCQFGLMVLARYTWMPWT